MAEPTEPLTGLIVPNTGDLVGAWGTAALNPNFSGIGGMFGGVGIISLSSSTTISLSTSGATFTPGAGPNQSWNAGLFFVGGFTGTATIQFTRPGYYIISNFTVPLNSTAVVSLAPGAGTGNVIGAPQGRLCHVFFDGTSLYYVNMPEVGSYLDLAVSTTPAWMNACTIAPYLPCNGAVYSNSAFAQLALVLGTTWGGVSGLTFGVPDLQNRYRIPLDLGGNNRITVAGAGVNGAALGSIGGSQFMQQFTPSGTIGGSQTITGLDTGQNNAAQPLGGGNPIPTNFNDSRTINGSSFTFTGNPVGSGNSQNLPPAAVAGMTFIKT